MPDRRDTGRDEETATGGREAGAVGAGGERGGEEDEGRDAASGAWTGGEDASNRCATQSLHTALSLCFKSCAEAKAVRGWTEWHEGHSRMKGTVVAMAVEFGEGAGPEETRTAVGAERGEEKDGSELTSTGADEMIVDGSTCGASAELAFNASGDDVARSCE
jgi:hypothetical protein